MCSSDLANFPNVRVNLNGGYPSQSSSSSSYHSQSDFDTSFLFVQAKDPYERPNTPGPGGRQEKDTDTPSKYRHSSRRSSRSRSKNKPINVKFTPNLDSIPEGTEDEFTSSKDTPSSTENESISSSSKENNHIKNEDRNQKDVTVDELLGLKQRLEDQLKLSSNC